MYIEFKANSVPYEVPQEAKEALFDYLDSIGYTEESFEDIPVAYGDEPEDIRKLITFSFFIEEYSIDVGNYHIAVCESYPNMVIMPIELKNRFWNAFEKYHEEDASKHCNSDKKDFNNTKEAFEFINKLPVGYTVDDFLDDLEKGNYTGSFIDALKDITRKK